MATRSGEHGEPVVLDVDGFEVRISNPLRPYFSARGETKLDLANYYVSVGPGIVRALRERPCMLHRFPDGVDGDKVHQKRIPRGAPPWLETVRLHFPRWGLHADELCVTRLADVIWAVQMSTVEFHPWNSRRADTETPDEWRIDLDPMPQAPYAAVRRTAQVAHEVLDELDAVGWPKTSGGRGLHIYVRITPEHGFSQVRRAALAFAYEVERRLPEHVTTQWWRKDRPGDAVFVDDDHPDGMVYTLPHGDRVVCGGTDRAAASGEGDPPQPDAAVEAAILERCRTAVPALAQAPVLSRAIGLRPVAPAVRLARHTLQGRVVVTNYGHGGAGVTLSWGCAEEVVALVGGDRRRRVG